MNIIKAFLDRIQTTNPVFFRWIMFICAVLSFFILSDQWINFIDLGNVEVHYNYILGIIGSLFAFSWLPNNDKNPKKLSNLWKKNKK